MDDCDGTEEWDDGMEECVEEVSSCEGAEAALAMLLVEDEDLRCIPIDFGVNSGEDWDRLIG